jgi:DNA-binding NarL/FixJ family response regulator
LLQALALAILKNEFPQGILVNRPRILLADDNESLVERVAEHLSSSFDVVGIARDGQDLISKALRLAPDVIVADITMPILTGIEATHQLREAGLAVRFVFLTIHGEDEFLQACLEEGAVGYVIKSHMNADLIPALNSAMAGKLFVSPSLSIPASGHAPNQS